MIFHLSYEFTTAGRARPVGAVQGVWGVYNDL
jgi:hypothetical protein